MKTPFTERFDTIRNYSSETDLTVRNVLVHISL